MLNINGQNQLHEADIKSTPDTNFIWDLPDAVYRIHLDNNSEITSANMTYTAATDKTTFTLPTGLFNLADTVVAGQEIVDARPSPAPAQTTTVATVSLLNAAHSGATDGDIYDVLNSTGITGASPSVSNLPTPTTLWNSQMSVRVVRTSGLELPSTLPIS